MKNLHEFPTIFFVNQYVDFRKGRHGLAQVVQSVLSENPFSNTLFVFMSKNKQSVKCLYWDKNGFAMWHKSLEKERFPWLKNTQIISISVTAKDAELLFSGIDIWKIKRHKELNYSLMI